MRDLTPDGHSNEELPLPPAGDTLRTGMRTAIHGTRWLGLAAGLALLASLALSLAPGAGAGGSKASSVSVEGAGTLAWRQVGVLASPRAGVRPSPSVS